MPTHRVQQGDCLFSIAHRYGFADYKVIYDHPDNAAFKKKRPNPNIIFPGDQVFVPPRENKTVDRPTGKSHTFTLKRPKTTLRIVLKDRDGSTIPDSDYVLAVGGSEVRGKTAGGLVDAAIPADAGSAELRVPTLGVVLALNLGHLDPPDTVSGAQARLANLRYDAGAADGDHGPRTRAAILAYQHDRGLDETGELDGATRGALEKDHGS